MSDLSNLYETNIENNGVEIGKSHHVARPLGSTNEPHRVKNWSVTADFKTSIGLCL